MSTSVENVFFALLRFDVTQIAPEENIIEFITPEVLPSLYKLSKKHDLVHIVADALVKNNLLPSDDEVARKFLRERDLAVYRYRQLEYELGQISRALEDAEVQFMPLKGSILRAYYPEPWMRTSCDIDVLVREESLEHAIAVLTEKLNYKRGNTGTHDVTLVAPSGVHVELHFSLSTDDNLTEIFEDVFDSPTPGWSYRYSMSWEMFYFYHIVHMAIHMRSGGCGVKPFLDMIIIKEKISYSKERAREILSQYGFLSFESEASNLSECWFSHAEFTPVTEALSSYILHGGVYGNIENRMAVTQTKKRGKLRYILSRVFVSFYELSIKYPSLNKRQILFPLYQIYRWFDLLTNKKSRDYAKVTVHQTYKLDDDRVATIDDLFRALEL